MEKIREALAKARMDKSFRDQHPVADEERTAADGAGTEFGTTLGQQDAPYIGQSPMNDLPEEPASPKVLPADKAESLSTSTEGPGTALTKDASSSITGEAHDDVPVQSVETNAQAVAPVTADKVEGGYQSKTASVPEEGAVPNPPLLDVDESALEEGAGREESRAQRDDDAPALVQKRTWSRRDTRRLLAAVFLGALLIVWGVHKFYYPLNSYFDGVTEIVDQYRAWLSAAVDPYIEQALDGLADAWMSALETVRELIK
ncbi:hypothetical protein EOI86_23585 [Hwanghaeella grinnelliae]|uniref:Uncharacterized protein n=1 Tax=Hwanghaeella grinnelliae TaxID=2500179 RepID=A0A3S2Y0I3_9PROT|nr:hypothetical protein [Hwanghaeella grinnelliae]RVU34101.1 hypothetical protein EOI86_23585 [Hwanghaeella grinnelliae]